MNAGFHGNLNVSVAAESTSPQRVRRHAWMSRLSMRQKASDENRADHFIPRVPLAQGLLHKPLCGNRFHICPQKLWISLWTAGKSPDADSGNSSN
jgi:hypothetical protein